MRGHIFHYIQATVTADAPWHKAAQSIEIAAVFGIVAFVLVYLAVAGFGRYMKRE